MLLKEQKSIIFFFFFAKLCGQNAPSYYPLKKLPCSSGSWKAYMLYRYSDTVAKPGAGQFLFPNRPFQIMIGKIWISPDIPSSALLQPNFIIWHNGSQLHIVLVTVLNQEPLAQIIKLCESLILKFNISIFTLILILSIWLEGLNGVSSAQKIKLTLV